MCLKSGLPRIWRAALLPARSLCILEPAQEDGPLWKLPAMDLAERGLRRGFPMDKRWSSWDWMHPATCSGKKETPWVSAGLETPKLKILMRSAST